MTLNDFNISDEMEQLEAVWRGSHIGNRQENEYSILLYQIDGFYVEVYYNQEENLIRRVRSFTNTEQLKPYLEQLNIENLLNDD